MLQSHAFIRCFFIDLIFFICFPLTPALLLSFFLSFFLSLPIAFYLSFLSLAVLFNRYFLLSFNIFPLSSPRSLSPSPSLTPSEFPHALLVPSRLDGTLTLHTGLMLMLDAWRFVQFAASVSRRIYEASVIHEGSSGPFTDAGWSGCRLEKSSLCMPFCLISVRAGLVQKRKPPPPSPKP